MSAQAVLSLMKREARASVIVAALVVTALALFVWGPKWEAQAEVDKRQDSRAADIHQDVRAVLKALGVKHPRHGEHDAGEDE